VKDATDIVSVIGEYVPLKKSGSSYKGLCPFHSEKSPSFMVSPNRNGFHCFGCGKGGNVITFVMEMEKMPFPEALRLLAGKAGVDLPKPQESERDQAADRARERMLELNEFAGKFFHEKLLSSEGQPAREYFKGRGFTKEDALKYLIGFAPAGWDSLKNAAQKAGFSQEELLAAGLVVHNEEKNSYYDKFRNRLIFPVRNNYDKIIAFGGRTLSDESGPKYLNSPETLLFKKSECLYLLDMAREAIRQRGSVLVVEGYFDALALHHFGFENAVATLGTALTSQHGRVLARYTKDVVFSYDADTAGQAAVLRGFEPLIQSGLNIRVLVMPDAKDPDEYLKKHSKEDFEVLLQKSPDFFRWWAQSLKKKFQGTPVEERLRALQGFAPMILQIPDEVSVQAACAAIESELGLDNRDLLTIVNSERKRGFRRPTVERDEAQGSKSEGAPVSKKEAGVKEPPLEADFLALLVEENGEFVPWAVNELSPEVFQKENFRQLFEKLSAGEMKAGELNQVSELEPSFLRIENQTEKKHREAMLIDLAAALKKRHLKNQLAEIKTRQAEAEKAGEVEQALSLAQQMILLKRQYSQEVETK
ncbi:MAG TPA: DNA primase, partial [bacterium]|nr:DNA primase [bacterium]